VSTYASGEFMKRKAAAVALLDFTPARVVALTDDV
jgi:hypothetical protein